MVLAPGPCRAQGGAQLNHYIRFFVFEFASKSHTGDQQLGDEMELIDDNSCLELPEELLTEEQLSKKKELLSMQAN